MKEVEVVKIDIFRRIMRISRSDRIENEKIRI
jgi:hypothetical protein